MHVICNVRYCLARDELRILNLCNFIICTNVRLFLKKIYIVLDKNNKSIGLVRRLTVDVPHNSLRKDFPKISIIVEKKCKFNFSPSDM